MHVTPEAFDAEAEVFALIAEDDETAGRLIMAEANRTRAKALHRRAALAREVAQWVEDHRARECGHEQCRDDEGRYLCVVRD